MPEKIREVKNRKLEPSTMEQKHHSLVQMIAEVWSTPILTPVLNHLILIRLLVIAAFLQIILASVGLPTWRCPINSLLDFSCPGCGLTSASALLIKGEWIDAIRIHAFAPIVILAFIFLFAFSIVPKTIQRKIINQITVLEKKSGIVILILLSMVVYWGIRAMDLI